MELKITKQEMIDFETKIADIFDGGSLPYLIHYSGGNEDKLIKIFSEEINEGDYIFSTHRSHYHYLLAGGAPDDLERKICEGKSMFVFNRKLNFFSSSIVAATPAIAAGVAWALKRKGSKQKVWCFIGDGAEDEGHFYEAARYVDGWQLPCTFIIEDNNRSVSASKTERYGNPIFVWPNYCVRRYSYVPTYPHGGNGRGKWVKFTCEAKVVERSPKKSSVLVDYTHWKRESEAVDYLGQNLSYFDASKQSMEMLAKDGAIFVGYNVRHGSAYNTLKDIPEDQRLETPVAENLMAGLVMGMSLEGFHPVLFFERNEFVLNAADALMNTLDIIEIISDGEFRMPIIIKCISGSIRPFYAGITHSGDLTNLFREMFSFPVYEPLTPGQIIQAYNNAWDSSGPTMVCEKKFY